MRRLMFVAILTFVFAIVQSGTTAVAGQQAPTNLMVLPKDMTRQQVTQVMRGFTRALGVRCQYCHVGEGNDLSTFDFASDAKPTKEIARTMLTMVEEINTKFLAGIGEPAAPGAAPAPKLTCYTCHRGATRPATAPPPGEGRGGAMRFQRGRRP